MLEFGQLDIDVYCENDEIIDEIDQSRVRDPS